MMLSGRSENMTCDDSNIQIQDALNKPMSALNENRPNEKKSEKEDEDRQSDVQTAGNTTSEESEEKSKDKRSKNRLIKPCPICGDQATGVRHGAKACEPCKGFFRRSLMRREEYTCKKGTNDCEVQKSKCYGCRFKRCLVAGMTKRSKKQRSDSHTAKSKKSAKRRKHKQTSEKSGQRSEVKQMRKKSDKKSRYKQPKLQLLPACRVCGDQATGFHYGVTTCEACKGFYGRSITRKKEYTCLKGTNDCDVAPKNAPCSECRLKRCLDVGMSKKGIKRGRYSYDLQMKHTIEVKGLLSEDLSPAPSTVFTKAIKKGKKRRFVAPCEASAQATGTIQPPSEAQRTLKNGPQISATEEFCKRKSLTDTLSQSYVKYCRFPDHLLENLKSIQKDYARQKFKHREHFRPWVLMDSKTFSGGYQSTGINDDYTATYFQNKLDSIERSIFNLVSFAKSIPGFQSIAKEDKVTLIKSVQFHWWFLCAYPGFCTETMIYTSRAGDCIFKHEMVRFTGKEYTDMVFTMGERFSSLQMDETERALVIALCIFSCDFSVQDLQDYCFIDALHREIGETLYFYTKRHNTTCRFGHIMSALTALRSAEGLHIEGRNQAWKIFEETQFGVYVPPLVMELWAGLIPVVNPDKVNKVKQVMSSQSKGKADNQIRPDIIKLL